HRWTRPSKLFSKTMIIAAIGWSFCLIVYWLPGDATFDSGWKSGAWVLIGLVPCVGLIVAFASSSEKRRRGVAAALVILAASEYKAFGTSKRFNASAGRAIAYDTDAFRGMNQNT